MKNVILQLPLEIIKSEKNITSEKNTLEILELAHVRIPVQSADLLDENGNKIGRVQVPMLHNFFLDRVVLFNKKEEKNEV
jgi:hypothetical protein